MSAPNWSRFFASWAIASAAVGGGSSIGIWSPATALMI